ncbi:MAG TPA: alpha/beta fold hydrolase, partial [Gemmatimonadota bacterium]|nr:alpha/beta fold hydrolase [Gemmatimonadota bacterium]
MSGHTVRQRQQTATRRPITSATFLAAGLIAASGCLFATPASAQLWASQTPLTSMVDVDGHRVRIRTAAPHPRRLPGQPLVVLEAGFGSTVNSWGPFIGQVAAVAPVLAYDRAGLGESEWDGQTPTFDHITGRLRRLLAEVGAEPPFVLVGHSFGGGLVRFF